MKDIFVFLNKLFNVEYSDSEWIKFTRVWNTLNIDIDFIGFENLNHVEFNQNIEQIINSAFCNVEMPVIIENEKLKINFPIKKLEQILNETD